MIRRATRQLRPKRRLFWTIVNCRRSVPAVTTYPALSRRFSGSIFGRQIGLLQASKQQILRSASRYERTVTPLAVLSEGIACTMRDTGAHGRELDRAAFQKTVSLKALTVPKQECHKYMKLLKSFVFKHSKLKAVLEGQDPSKRIILLKEDSPELGNACLPEEIAESLKAGRVQESVYNLQLDYSLLSCEAVLQQILPAGCDIPSSFETIGHIAHLNLREEHEPYKHIIGQVILDKNSTIKTVVNKVGILEDTFRVLPLEVIAGEDQMMTTVKQHNTRFRLNYAEVYWNSRLEEEHKRLVALFQPEDVVIDVMAGIGPFAIPAAQQGNEVFANDLNPKSYHWLQENVKLNKVYGLVHAYQLDGRDFIRLMAGGKQPPSGVGKALEMDNTTEAVQPLQSGVIFHHAVMNLPASAVEFLDALYGSFDMRLWQGYRLPFIHVYTFARNDEGERDIRKRVEASLGGAVHDDWSVKLVRDVAPNKRMMRVTFRVPEAVAFGQGHHINGGELDGASLERDKKRLKSQSS